MKRSWKLEVNWICTQKGTKIGLIPGSSITCHLLPAAHTLPLPAYLILYPTLCHLSHILLLSLPHTSASQASTLPHVPNPHCPACLTSLPLPSHHSTPLLHPASCKLLPSAACPLPSAWSAVPQSHSPERVGFSNTWGEVSAAEKAPSQ